MMENEFIPYEEAQALADIGFDEECLAIYYKDDVRKKLLFSIAEKYSSNPEVAKHQARDTIRAINFEKGWAIGVPLYQQALRFFRKKGFGIIEKPFYSSTDTPNITYAKDIIDWETGKVYKMQRQATYEEAELDCLRKLIEIYKAKKDDISSNKSD
jgi:hypothetical protein